MDEKDWGMWAVSIPGIEEFIGFIGLNNVDKSTFPAHFTPAIEIGWRLVYEFWGWQQLTKIYKFLDKSIHKV